MTTGKNDSPNMTTVKQVPWFFLHLSLNFALLNLEESLFYFSQWWNLDDYFLSNVYESNEMKSALGF